jgi:hypothetical protein
MVGAADADETVEAAASAEVVGADELQAARIRAQPKMSLVFMPRPYHK